MVALETRVDDGLLAEAQQQEEAARRHVSDRQLDNSECHPSDVSNCSRGLSNYRPSPLPSDLAQPRLRKQQLISLCSDELLSLHELAHHLTLLRSPRAFAWCLRSPPALAPCHVLRGSRLFPSLPCLLSSFLASSAITLAQCASLPFRPGALARWTRELLEPLASRPSAVATRRLFARLPRSPHK